MSDFSIFLEQLIRENGYSIYGFAQEAGVDRPTLHRVLKGQLTPSTSFFQKIVKTLRLFPREREQLTQNYNILKNGESVFRQRIYIKERLEHLNDFIACRPQLSGDAVAAGENGLPTEPIACIRGEYRVESVIRQVLLEELKGQKRPVISTNILEGPSYVGRALLQLYLEREGQLEIRHLIRFHKSIGSHMHNLTMLFDALLFSFSPGDGYRPCFYYENVSQYTDPASLFHSYLMTKKHVLCLSEDLKVAALIQEPQTRACYEQCFQRTIAAAEPLLQRAASLEEGYRIEEAFYRGKEARTLFSVSGGLPCLYFCCTPEILRTVGRFEYPQGRALFEITCQHYERLAQSIKTSAAVTTVDSFRSFLQTGRVHTFPAKYVRPFDLSTRIVILERLLDLIHTGRIKLYLINPVRFHFPEQISIHVSEDQKCIVYANPTSGYEWGTSVQVKEKTLRKALLDFTVSLPESELVYTARESEGILRNLMQAARSEEEERENV